MNKIIVPIDFSKNAFNALEYALSLAKLKKEKTEIVLLNCFFVIDELDEEVLKAYNANSREELLENIIELKTAGLDDMINVSGEIYQGAPPQMIIQNSEKHSAYIIIMGRTGVSPFQEKFFGSTTLQTLNGTETPVLVIPPDYVFSTDGIVSLSIDDRSVPNENTLNQFVSFHKLLDAPIELLHVEQRNPHSDIHKLTATKIVHMGYQIKLTKKYTTKVYEAILDFAHEKKPLVMAVIQHDFDSFLSKLIHKSLTNQIAGRLNVPLLVIHDVV